MSNLSHLVVPRNLEQHHLWIIKNCQVFSMPILIFLSLIRCMNQNKTKSISSKGIYELKIELLGFFYVTGVILHSIYKKF